MDNYVRKYYCDWDKEIEEFISSGKTFQDFCADKEYSTGGFQHHYYKKRRNGSGRRERDEDIELPVFLPVEIIDRPGREDIIKVNGFDLAVNEHTNIQALSTVLKAIGEISWK